ncbi:CBS domain-containing protein [Hugenholtzia roseola]|uniref:CBS domain-containing protein n=1 Tax=Hugenholtzia roseola TaxID=1002 RepID=UPI0004056E42|nr:CBS domain-containing protein [Hugenholtzia roseola]
MTHTQDPHLNTAAELINDLIPPLQGKDSIRKALGWMDGFRLTQLPVVENHLYKGMVTEDLLFEMNNPEAPISEVETEFADIFVSEHQHFFEVLKVASDHQLRIVPVLNAQKHFLGVITIRDTVAALARTYATQSKGSIFVLALDYVDYSLAHVSRLIEENNAKILSSYVDIHHNDPNKIKLTLKVNTDELTHILATLERFGYRIIAKFQETPQVELEQERLDLLFRYLDL